LNSGQAEPKLVVVPEEASYKRDILPLFRQLDISQMLHYFDLSDYADVCEYAEAIYERVEDGSMPCDEPWSEESVALFRRWIDEGLKP